ncbi:AraC family ligand binding domain-containing protein [Paenibacillus xylanivorans]|uniref:AraC-type arabinose-binding/dimerisation domain-containing protein n=1 Tax=Paenibacillus xylanivorans TaxID=1705561 RepID=A0A0M9BSN7_9BACL|nr:AraC family ligand binding domain-containing protein [Paenibacillus xylanivorans]KOY18248.1 hypothetical protein AMS66_01600 [Paenibacillus xylanivorans]
MKINEKKADKMLKYSSIDSFEVPWNGEVVHPAIAEHTAVLCTSGSGTLVSNEHISRLNEGEVYLLAPGQRFKLAADEQLLKGSLVRFDIRIGRGTEDDRYQCLYGGVIWVQRPATTRSLLRAITSIGGRW